jgi:hypothetical protein
MRSASFCRAWVFRFRQSGLRPMGYACHPALPRIASQSATFPSPHIKLAPPTKSSILAPRSSTPRPAAQTMGPNVSVSKPRSQSPGSTRRQRSAEKRSAFRHLWLPRHRAYLHGPPSLSPHPPRTSLFRHVKNTANTPHATPSKIKEYPAIIPKNHPNHVSTPLLCASTHNGQHS